MRRLFFILNELEIEAVTGRGILNSRGNPVVEVEVCLVGGAIGWAAAPSGASIGKLEAVELRDGEERYNGRGVKKTAEHVDLVLNEVVFSESALDQRRLDQMLLDADGTESKGKLGMNVTLGVSMAVARTTTNGLYMPLYRYLGGIYASQLPIPMMNVLNGGRRADNTMDLQEFMVMSYGVYCFSKRLRMCAEAYHTLKKPLKEDGYSIGMGDEGGFAPDLKNSEEVLKYLVKAMEKNGLKSDVDMKIAIGAAFSELYDEVSGMYLFPGESRMAGRQIHRSASEMVEYCRGLVERFPTCPIEGGLEEEDWEGWKMLTRRSGDRVQLMGDDLFATNTKRLAKEMEMEAGNVTLVKVNRISTLTENSEAIEMTKWAGFGTTISHRSGEIEDSIIVGIAAVMNTGQIKIGMPCCSDHVVKYSQLLRIKENLTLEV